MTSLAPLSADSAAGPSGAASQRVRLPGRLGDHFEVALAVLCLVAITAAELITSYVSLVYGVVAHVVILFGLLSAGALVTDRRLRALFLGSAVGPLVRIVSLGIPLGRFPQPYWYVLTAIPLFLATGLIARELGLTLPQLNLRVPARRTLPVEVLVAVSGVGLGVVEWKILGVKPIVHGVPLWEIAGVAAILLVCTGFLEELVFRGLIQHVASALLGSRGGLLFMAFLFAALHIGWESPVDLAFVFGVAVYFGLVVRYTRSLLGVTFAHGAINTMLFVVLPLAFSP